VDPVVACFGIACGATIVLSWLGGERDALLLALVETLSWAASNIAWISSTWVAFPLMDALFLIYVATLANGGGWQGWRLALVWIAYVQLLLDIAFETGGYGAYRIWATLLNATFALELLVIASGGWWRHGIDRSDGHGDDGAYSHRSAP
jgi:hypothetical protein